MPWYLPRNQKNRNLSSIFKGLLPSKNKVLTKRADIPTGSAGLQIVAGLEFRFVPLRVVKAALPSTLVRTPAGEQRWNGKKAQRDGGCFMPGEPEMETCDGPICI